MTLTDASRNLLIFLVTLAVILPASMMLPLTPAHAAPDDFGSWAGEGGSTGGSGGNTGGGNVPKEDPVRNDKAPGGKVESGGGHSKYSYISSRTKTKNGKIHATVTTKEWVSGVVDFRTGKSDGVTHTGHLMGAALACRVAGAVGNNSMKEIVGAKVTLTVTTKLTYPEDSPNKIIKRSESTSIQSVSCLSLNFSKRQVKCYVDATGTIDKVAPSKSRVTSKTNKTRYGNGDRSYQGCLNSRSVVVSVSTVLSGYGRWHAKASFRYELVTARVPLNKDPITGKTPPTTIISRGGVKNSATRHNYAQISCSGALVSSNRGSAWVGNPSWTHSECGPDSSKPIYQCTGVNNLPSINGQATRSATLFRDGEENSIRLPNVGLSGRDVSIKSSKTQMLRSGTPWNTNGSTNARTNDVQLKLNGSSKFTSARGTPWMSGKQRDFTVSSVWSSDKGAPTKITPQVEHTASVRVPTIQITGWKVTDSSNELYYNRGSVLVTSTAVCKLPPITLDFVRSKESN